MVIWNKDSNIADNDVRVVEFTFETNDGPGTVTAIVNKGVSIAEAKKDVLSVFEEFYDTIEIVHYEITEIIPDDGPLH